LLHRAYFLTLASNRRQGAGSPQSNSFRLIGKFDSSLVGLGGSVEAAGLLRKGEIGSSGVAPTFKRLRSALHRPAQ
jgi:hypothetical protein